MCVASAWRKGMLLCISSQQHFQRSCVWWLEISPGGGVFPPQDLAKAVHPGFLPPPAVRGPGVETSTGIPLLTTVLTGPEVIWENGTKILFFFTDADSAYKRCRNGTKNFSKISNLNSTSFIEGHKALYTTSSCFL